MADSVTYSKNAGGTLLIVDDDEVLLELLDVLLQQDGYRTLTATDGETALNVLSKHKVDVILSDLRMPGMTGTELLRRVKDLYPETVRIVQSGFADLASVTSAINEGAVYKFLTKPWNDTQLRNNIAEAFHFKYIEDENRNLKLGIENSNKQLVTHFDDYTETISFLEKTIKLHADIIEYMPCPAITFDNNKCLVTANEAALTLFEGKSFSSLGQLARNILDDATTNHISSLEIPNGSGHSYNVKFKTLRTFDECNKYILLLIPAFR